MRSHPKAQFRKPILHYAQRAIHSLLGAFTGWLTTGMVVFALGAMLGDPMSTTHTALVIALQITLLGWLFVGLPIALTLSKHTMRQRGDVITRYVVATITSFGGITLISLGVLVRKAPEIILAIVIFFLLLLLWAAAIGFVGGAVFWALQQRFAH